MKNLYLSLLLIGSFSSFSQEKLSANIFTGWLFPYNDFTETGHEGYQPNLAVGAGIGYKLTEWARLRGDLLYGKINGHNNLWYYETTLLEPQLGLDLNLIHVFSEDYDAVKFNLQGGTGLSYYAARLYDLNTSELRTQSPVRSEKAWSPNAFLSYGANVSIKLSHKLDINVGMTNRYVFDADWMDGFDGGDYTDHYGLAQIGFIYYLKSDRTPNTVEVDETRFQRLNVQADSVRELRQQMKAERERLAIMEMEQQEKDIRITSLQEELDSAQTLLAANLDTVRSRTSTQPSPDVEQILGEPRYRIVVASLPTRKMAQRWIESSTLDKSEMVIAYMEDLNTHRVVYRSFDTFQAARKEQQSIKRNIPDAWIIKF